MRALSIITGCMWTALALFALLSIISVIIITIFEAITGSVDDD